LATEEEIAVVEKMVTDLENRARRIAGNAPEIRSATGKVASMQRRPKIKL
jgi:hypothetical protein